MDRRSFLSLVDLFRLEHGHLPADLGIACLCLVARRQEESFLMTSGWSMRLMMRMFKAAGGRILAAGQKLTALEGKPPNSHVAVLGVFQHGTTSSLAQFSGL